MDVVCDTAKVRFFKQITTYPHLDLSQKKLFAILQKYDFSSKSQLTHNNKVDWQVVCDTAKVRFFKQITTNNQVFITIITLFAILQKYDFSSKSQHVLCGVDLAPVVCDTAKVRFFKQITTVETTGVPEKGLFAILQKYDFSSKSQQDGS